MKNQGKNFSAVILAGGRSERMGYPKPYLEVTGEMLVNRQITAFRQYTDNIVVVLNAAWLKAEWAEQAAKIKPCYIIPNEQNERGRLFSLWIALNCIGSSSFCFVSNIDNFPASSTIRELTKHPNVSGYTVPVYKQRAGHPILLSQKLCNNFLDAFPKIDRLDAFLSNYDRKNVEVDDPAILWNINTPEDYLMLVSSLKSSHNAVVV